MIVSGHWPPQEVNAALLERLAADGKRLAELHRELLPLDEVDFGAGGFGARIEPYRSSVRSGEGLTLDVTVRNPFEQTEAATVRLVVPDGWPVPAPHELELPGSGEATASFEVDTSGLAPVERARIAADLTVGEVPFGQQAEALVDVE